MIIQSESVLIIPLRGGLSARINVSISRLQTQENQGHLIFLNASLLYLLIDRRNSLNPTITRTISQSIRSKQQSCIGHVAYIKTSGETLSILNSVSELAAISMLGSEYLPVAADERALMFFKKQHYSKVFDTLPSGWLLDERTQCQSVA